MAVQYIDADAPGLPPREVHCTMSAEPLTTEARRARLHAAGATIEDVSGRFAVLPPEGGAPPEIIPACRVTLEDGRKFPAGGSTYDKAEAAAMARAEAALGLS